MDSLNQFISFWGGVASIVALLISVIGGFLILLKKLKIRYEKELKELHTLEQDIAERTKSATSQGKRMDLYIYYQSILSDQRFQELIEEVRISSFHIASFLLILFITALDSNANYYLDIVFGKGDILYNNFGLVYGGVIILFLYFNVSIRLQSNKNRKVLNAITMGLIKELHNLINTK